MVFVSWKIFTIEFHQRYLNNSVRVRKKVWKDSGWVERGHFYYPKFLSDLSSLKVAKQVPSMGSNKKNGLKL